MGSWGRIVAVGIAVIAWIGLGMQFLITYRQNLSVPLTLWILIAFFTILTNLLVALVFTGIAINRAAPGPDGVIAGTMLSILLVGIIYGLLLHGLTELSGSSVVNVLLHMVTPVLVPLFWIVFIRKGDLRWHHPLLWAIYPLAYLVYALARGVATGSYAYPFLDVRALGWERTALNAGEIAIGFMLSGFVILWIDHRIGTSAAAEARY